MMHVVFSRPTGKLKVFSSEGTILDTFEATGDAWRGASGGSTVVRTWYGHNGQIPPGHYFLGKFESWTPADATPAEGFGQIYVEDLSLEDVKHLEDANAAQQLDMPDGRTLVVVGGITGPIGGLAKYERSAIMIHGGGSNAPDPMAPDQPLCATNGCTRVHNQDWPHLVNLLAQTNLSFPPEATSGQFQETVVFSVVGDSPPATC